MLNATTKKMNKFSSNKNFEILNQANTNRMCEIYLRKTKGEYHLIMIDAINYITQHDAHHAS